MLLFMNTHIKYVTTCIFMGFSIRNNDITNSNIQKTVQSFYCKSSEVFSYFRHVTPVVKEQLLSSYCLYVYGSQLWHFNDKSVNLFFDVVAWSRTIRKLW